MEGVRRLVAFDPLNLPSSERLVRRHRERIQQQQTKQREEEEETEHEGIRSKPHENGDKIIPGENDDAILGESDGASTNNAPLGIRRRYLLYKNVLTRRCSSLPDLEEDSDFFSLDSSSSSLAMWGLRNRSKRRSSGSISTSSEKEETETNSYHPPKQRQLSEHRDRGCGSEAAPRDPPFGMRTAFGQTVHWSELRFHYREDELEPYRGVGDPEMDALLDLCATEGMPGAGRFDDILRLSKDAHTEGEEQELGGEQRPSPSRRALARFYADCAHPPPEIADWDSIQRGIDVFVAYAPAAAASLYYRSLVGGFSIPKITKVLFATRYLAPPSPPPKVRERLLDTGGFLASVMMPTAGDEAEVLPAASVRPHGAGWEAALRVRHLHARIRRSILNSTATQWDSQEFGVPINQEDMAATVLAFSVNVLVGIEFIAGRALSEREQLDYLALWRYLGWLLGVETRTESTPMQRNAKGLPPLDPCSGHKATTASLQSPQPPDPIGHSYSALESIILHLLHPNETSQSVAKHLLNIGGNGQLEFGYEYRSFMCRRHLGHDLANALDLACPATFSVRYGLLFCLTWLHLMLLRVYTRATLHLPFVRRRVVAWHRNGLGKFHKAWETGHGKRVSKARKEALPRAKNHPISSHSGLQECPFAMMMPPE